MFSDNTIEKRVMEVIKNKVKATQKSYDEGVKALEAELEERKTKLADNLVNDLIGKII